MIIGLHKKENGNEQKSFIQPGRGDRPDQIF